MSGDTTTLAAWNDSARPYPDDRCVHELIEAQAALTPDRTAVEFGAQRVTYRQVDERANQLAWELVEFGLGPDDRVAVCVERSPEMVIGVLAVLKAGGAFVPLDPAYPAKRLRFMLRDSQPRALLTQASLASVFDERPGNTICIDRDGPRLARHGNDCPPRSAGPHHLAYVIYTSGSTGAPKGVMIEHRGLCNLAGVLAETFAMSAESRVLQFASFSFDAWVADLLMTLTTGAALCLAGPEALADGLELVRTLRERAITTVTLPPALLASLPSQGLPALTTVCSAGDACPPAVALRWASGRRFLNGYGPTEATVAAAYHLVTGRETMPVVPIGRPVANTRLYVLDEELQVLPGGEVGELHIAGVGLARGYLGHPELTAERFVPDVHRPHEPGSRLYRTGDLVRRRPDGNLEFVGRRDNQVKIRGFRIEPEEIERALLEHPDVRGCAVVAAPGPGHEQRLVAHVVPRDHDRMELWPSVAEYFVYDDVLYYAMTHDERRNASYRAAIAAAVAGRVVVDIGTGKDAVLARMCAEHGARKVYALDVLAESCRSARAIVARLGLDHCIEVIHGDARTVTLPEPADVSVSEIVGPIGGSEGAASIINDARRLLGDRAEVIPRRSTTMIAAVTLPAPFVAGPAFSRATAHYVEQIFAQTGRPFDLRLCLKGVGYDALISRTGVFEDLDFTRPLPLAYRREVSLAVTVSGRMDGFLVWLTLDTGGGEPLDILAHEHCWLPVYLPAPHPGVQVEDGDRIEVTIDGRPCHNGLNPDYELEGRLIRVDGSTLEFSHRSHHSSPEFRQSDFYRSLFPGGRARILESGRVLKPAQLRSWLAERLPGWMIPAAFVTRDALPLTPNGKADRGALRAVDWQQLVPESRFVAPRTAVERTIAEIWQEVLGIERLGVEDDFFDLGADSLLVSQVAARLRRAFGCELPLDRLFERRTIQGLAQAILQAMAPPAQERDPRGGAESSGRAEPAGGGAPGDQVGPRLERLSPVKRALLERRLLGAVAPRRADAIPRRKPGDPSPLSFAQQRLWFLDQWAPGGHTYNASLPMRLDGRLDVQALRRALAALVERHEILRTTYAAVDGEPLQRVLQGSAVGLPTVDLRQTPPAAREDELARVLRREAQRPFDLSRELMLRAVLVALAPDQHALLIVAHHIACDGWSKIVLFEELAEFYDGFARGNPPSLPELPIQYGDYALWQRRWLQGAVLDREVSYWRDRLSGSTLALCMPTDRPRPPVQRFVGALHWLEVDRQLTDEIRELGRREGATLFMTLLAAFDALIHGWTGAPDILVGSPIANRHRVETEKLIGFFVNTLVLRTDLSGDPSFRELLGRVRSSALGAYAHDGMPFEKLVEALRPPRDSSRNPLFQVNFRVQATPPPHLRLAGLSLRPIRLDPGSSRFDFALELQAERTGLAGYLEYNTDLFDAGTIAALARDFVDLIADVVRHPDLPLGELRTLRELAPRRRAARRRAAEEGADRSAGAKPRDVRTFSC